MERVDENRGFEPEIAVPPGETLKESIDALGMSQAELALRMNRPQKTINEIIKGKAAITPQTAIELERVLRVPAHFWLRLEMNYQTALARQEQLAEIKKDLQLLEKFPYLEMSKHGWVDSVKDKAARVAALRSFYGVVTLGRVQLVEQAAYRKSQKKEASPEALSAWLRKGELDAQRIQTAEFDRNAFVSALSEIRELTRDDIRPASERLRELCAANGVVVTFVPHLAGTYVNGVARWLTATKALIQLSIRYRYEDIFWFTFFHECGHILKQRKKEVFIDMTGDVQSDDEAQADAFARDTLIPAADYRRLCALQPFSAEKIELFATSIGISPAIVVGRLHHDGLLPQNHLNHLRRKLKWADKTE
jgi:addiction module HigA family antidote